MLYLRRGRLSISEPKDIKIYYGGQQMETKENKGRVYAATSYVFNISITVYEITNHKLVTRGNGLDFYKPEKISFNAALLHTILHTIYIKSKCKSKH